MRIFLALIVAVVMAVQAPSALAQTKSLQAVLQENAKDITRPSRKTVDAVIENLLTSDAPGVPEFLRRWREKEVWLREEDDLFVFGDDKKEFDVIDIDTGETLGRATSRDLKQIKPNSGVRGVISSALVRFQLSDPDPKLRRDALKAIERDPEASHLEPLRASIAEEADPVTKARKERLERLLTISFGDSDEERIAAMQSFRGDTELDVRAALNPLLVTRMEVAEQIPEDENVAVRLVIGRDLTTEEAYDLLVSADLAPERVSDDARNEALIANIVGGTVAGIPVSTLDTNEARDTAYEKLSEEGKVPPFVTTVEREELVKRYKFFEVYTAEDKAVTDEALSTLNSITRAVGLSKLADLGLDALSLASIYFLAAIGLAITFGVMGVINMAHGEFIMMGAYTGYVVQLFVDDYTASIIIALPLAFAVTFLAGVVMERLVIRHLMHRPLETLLATFGISIALQQLAKNIFGTQARPLTAPSWLDGSLVFNDIVQISYIRIAIFVLACIFFVLLLLILNRTRLGLEVRAVTQNPRMAASMGINPDRINMITFGLGSGIAGIAGVAIGLFAQVTSELGTNYIVQSFMTVVVGGVGNIWGTLAGAGMIGTLQKIIEWFNPSNTLAAQTYMIIFIIIFIQFRPKGIIALKGRAAGD
jgi:urea transport system permease protein